MAYVRIWVHCVWGTKRRIPLLTKDNKWNIINHIKENSKLKDIYIDHVNGHENHLHCLVSLNADQCISKVMQLIKGESSFWINKNKIAHDEFEWADEYYAVSISESQVAKVRKYIKNQEDHHKHKTWEQECEEFM